MGGFNVAGEAQSIFTANQSAIQQILASGKVNPTDYGAILGILIGAGLVTNSPLAGGFATFGGNLTNCTGNNMYTCKGAATTFGLAPGTLSANIALNSSDTRELDKMQLRLGDGEAATD